MTKKVLGAGLLASALVLAACSSPMAVERVPAPATPAAAPTVATSPPTPSAPPPAAPETVPAPPLAPAVAPVPLEFDASRALADIRALAKIGVRQAGSENERAAADYIAERLSDMGYSPLIEEVPLSNGKTSHNVVVARRGTSGRLMVLGAHMDTKSPSPGANDNASGCAALLEIARVLADRRLVCGVEFVFFGSEEIIDHDSGHHHFGSRRFVEALTPEGRRQIAGMISVDMIGVGTKLHTRSMGVGPLSLAKAIRRLGASNGVAISYLADTAGSGSSDHEAFEKAGIPAVWLEWRDDPVYHTAKDTASHVDREHVRVVGQLLVDYLAVLDEKALAGL